MPLAYAGELAKRPAFRRTLKIVAALGVVAAIAVALRDVDVHGTLATMRGVPHTVVLLGLGFSLLQAGALATRLWAVFPSHARPRWTTVARAFGFGQFVNIYLPGRAGDVVKVVAIADSEKRRAALADATGVMLADKAIDVVTLLVLALVLGPELVARMARGALHSGWAIPLVIAGLVGAIFALRAVWPAGFEKLKAGASATWRATRSLFTPTRLTAALALGFGAWFAEVVILMVLCSALGSHLSFSQSVIALFVLNLGIAVPISVANVGAYEAATVMGLGQFGVGVPEALAIGTLHHAIQIASVVLVAGAFWLHDRVKRARAPR